MNEDESLLRFLEKFHGKRLLLDTNLLLPYFIGRFDRFYSQVPSPGSLQEEEFVLLARIIRHFEKAGRVLTTPHLLTEVSNISERLKQNQTAFLLFIRSMIRDLDERFDARRIGAARLAGQGCFSQFGLADTAIIDLAYNSIFILTNDQPMARYLQNEKKRRNVVYFGDLKKRCLHAYY